jgi:hypothetical protein
VSLCAEDRFLLACAGAPFRPTGGDDVRRLLGSELDWDYVLDASIRHVISPLVHAALEGAAPPDELARAVPQAVREEVRSLHEMTRLRSGRLYAALAEIAASFARDGVDALALKEIPLALQAFPDLALRPIGDIDLLIRADDYDRAVGSLRALGFDPVPHRDMPFTRKYACAHHLRRPEDEVWVDLQWNLAEREWDVYGDGNFTFDPETMWEGAVSLELGSGTVLAAPRPEPMLFHLCLHAEGHGYSELVLFADVAALLQREAVDWEALHELARRYDAEASVYYVLLLAQRLLGAAVPEQALRLLEPPYVPAGMANPLFGNLTQLHLALDDVRTCAHPPAKVADAMERVVRQQAAGAMTLYGEVDRLARRFKDRGGSMFVVEGAPSERIYPDAALPPFGQLTVVVLDQDLPHLTRSLADQGFEEDGQASSEELANPYVKSVVISSRDPVLRDRNTLLEVECTIAREWHGADVVSSEGRRSKKETALALVHSKADVRADGARLRAPLKVLALGVEDALAYLAARLGARPDGSLFALLLVAELVRAVPQALDRLDLDVFRMAVARSGLVTQVCDGLAIAGEVLGESRLESALDSLACTSRQPRVLEWARYGPGSLERHGEFKRAFFVLYTLSSLATLPEQAAYSVRILKGGRAHGPFAHSLLAELARGVASAVSPTKLNTRELAVWIEPDWRAGDP